MAHMEGEGGFRSKQTFRQWSLFKVQDALLILCVSVGKDDSAEKGNLKKIRQIKGIGKLCEIQENRTKQQTLTQKWRTSD